MPSVGRGPGGQASIRSSKATPSAVRRARPASRAGRCEDVGRDERPPVPPHVAEELDLLRQPGVVAASARPRTFGEAGEHLGRVADQERVGEPDEPLARAGRQQVVGHVLLVVDRRRRAAGRSVSGHDPLPVGRGCAITSSRAGVRRRRSRQVVRVERLVDDRRRRAGSPRPASARSRCCAAPTTSRCACAAATAALVPIAASFTG